MILIKSAFNLESYSNFHQNLMKLRKIDVLYWEFLFLKTQFDHRDLANDVVAYVYEQEQMYENLIEVMCFLFLDKSPN